MPHAFLVLYLYMNYGDKMNNLNKQNNYSSFWLDNGWDNNSSIFDQEDTKKKVDLIALASYRRAISNFVSIVTGESDIKVTFTTAGDSYTNGKEVTISSKLDDKLFDSTVGLALHEGSHIKLSDFDFLRQLDSNIPQEYYRKGEDKGLSSSDVLGKIHNLLNYVEDRRIDYFIFSNSPGYKGYYHSMYDKYFHSKIIDKALQTDEHTSLNWDSYLFRIINLTNTNSDLNVLPGLKDIHNVIFSNVKNLNSTQEAFKVALQVFDIVNENIPTPKSQETLTQGQSNGDESIEAGDDQGQGKGLGDDGSDKDTEQKKIELSPRQKKQLEKDVIFAKSKISTSS